MDSAMETMRGVAVERTKPRVRRVISAEAGELGLGGGEVFAGGFGESGVGTDEVEEVGDGFERVVDLVRDGGGEAAHGSELFLAEEGELRRVCAR